MAGKRASPTEPSTRVRVYERKDVSGIFMTCAWDQTVSGRPQEVKLPDGMTRETAETLAEITAAKRRERLLAGRTALGEVKSVTLGELLKRYHESSVAQDWSKIHRYDMGKGRDFWLLELDPDREVETLTTAEVEKIARDAREQASWGVRKQRKLLAYLRAATRWGCDKARLYDAYPLRGLDLPKYEPETDGLVFTNDEARLLCRGHPDADWRDVLAVNIACDTGRRITSVLSLAAEDILTDGEAILLRFRKEYDKGGRTGLVPVSTQTAELLADVLEEDVVAESGWLFPEGRLGYDDPRDKPRRKKSAIMGLRRLEQLVGVQSIERRAFHGLKRTHVTAAMEVSQGDTALVGDITGNLSAELLRRVYRRANKGRSREHVERIRRAIEGDQYTR